mgnify:CR=1 FL=1
MKKSLFVLSFICFCLSCANKAERDVQNAYARNNIESCQEETIDLTPEGAEISRTLTSTVHFDQAGNRIKEISNDINFTYNYKYRDSLLTEISLTNAEGKQTFLARTSYNDKQRTDSIFDSNMKIDEPDIRNCFYSKEIRYTDSKGRDTLITRYDNKDNMVYKVICIYDEIGLQEMNTHSVNDSSRVKRVNDDKLKQVFECTNSTGQLLYKETKWFNEREEEVEFLYESFLIPDTKDISHRKTNYLDNGLIDEIISYDNQGIPTRKMKYTYKTFASEKL